MAGFDNGTPQSGVRAQTKQFGPILRGLGPPAPTAGAVGDLYIDTQTYFLYAKRSAEGTDPWGDYLFQVPAAYQPTLKWFSSSLSGSEVGVAGDYCLMWAGYNNYGAQPSVYGPKIGDSWPESGTGPDLPLDPAYAGYELPVGLSNEGAAVAYSNSTQLVVCGLAEEYILAIPVVQTPNLPVEDVGLITLPAHMTVNLNPLFTATNAHAV